MSFEKLRRNFRVFHTMLHVSHSKSNSGETRWLDGKMEAEIKGNLAFVPIQNQRRECALAGTGRLCVSANRSRDAKADGMDWRVNNSVMLNRCKFQRS